MSGDEQLLDMIARLNKLGGGTDEIAKAAAPAVQAANRATASAGTTPYGESWKPRKAGSAPVLANAASAIVVEAKGPRVRIKLVGNATGSQQVQAIQNARRPIIPTQAGGIPKPVEDAIKSAATKFFETTMKGGA